MVHTKTAVIARMWMLTSSQLGPYRQVHQGPAFGLPSKRTHRSTRTIYPRHSSTLLPFLHPTIGPRVSKRSSPCCNELNVGSLKPIDIVVLKKLSDVVNVVPVIAKSDSLTLDERMAFKERIKEEFAFHNLRMYPYDNEEQDQEERAMNSSIKDLIPFAVVGSENSIVVNGRQVRGRQNRWGVINVEDENHCEFVALRDFLTRTHLQDLIETTSQIHYEVFRAKQLLALKENSATGAHSGSRPISPSAERELSRQSQRMTMNGY